MLSLASVSAIFFPSITAQLGSSRSACRSHSPAACFALVRLASGRSDHLGDAASGGPRARPCPRHRKHCPSTPPLPLSCRTRASARFCSCLCPCRSFQSLLCGRCSSACSLDIAVPQGTTLVTSRESFHSSDCSSPGRSARSQSSAFPIHHSSSRASLLSILSEARIRDILRWKTLW